MALNESGGPATARAHGLGGVRLFSMPAAQGQFAMELNEPQNLAATTVEVFSLQDRSLYQQGYGPQQTHLAVAAGLALGLYLVQVRRGAGVLTQKLTVL